MKTISFHQPKNPDIKIFPVSFPQLSNKRVRISITPMRQRIVFSMSAPALQLIHTIKVDSQIPFKTIKFGMRSTFRIFRLNQDGNTFREPYRQKIDIRKGMCQFMGAHTVFFIHLYWEIHLDPVNELHIASVEHTGAIIGARHRRKIRASIEVMECHMNLMLRLKTEEPIHCLVETFHITECTSCE